MFAKLGPGAILGVTQLGWEIDLAATTFKTYTITPESGGLVAGYEGVGSTAEVQFGSYASAVALGIEVDSTAIRTSSFVGDSGVYEVGVEIDGMYPSLIIADIFATIEAGHDLHSGGLSNYDLISVSASSIEAGWEQQSAGSSSFSTTTFVGQQYALGAEFQSIAGTTNFVGLEPSLVHGVVLPHSIGLAEVYVEGSKATVEPLAILPTRFLSDGSGSMVFRPLDIGSEFEVRSL